MSNDSADCTYLMSMAQRELGAFMSAVAELYGPSQARIAAGDWVDTFESISDSFHFSAGEWRKITIVAASRLATRLIHPAKQPPWLNESTAMT